MSHHTTIPIHNTNVVYYNPSHQLALPLSLMTTLVSVMNYTLLLCTTFLSYHHNFSNTDVTLFREVRARLFIYRRRLVMVILDR